MHSEASKIERNVVLDQIQRSKTNRAVRIFIGASLPRVLTKVNY